MPDRDPFAIPADSCSPDKPDDSAAAETGRRAADDDAGPADRPGPASSVRCYAMVRRV